MSVSGGDVVLPFWEMVLNPIKNIPCLLSNAPSWLQNSRPPREVFDGASPSHGRAVLKRDRALALDRGQGERPRSP